MFNLNNPFDNFFQVQREFDRMFNQFWADLPARTTNARSSFNVEANEDRWRIDVPLPGIDPKNVSLEVAGNTLTIRAEEPKAEGRQEFRYEQTLTIPVKDAVRPRKIQISSSGSDDRKQLKAREQDVVRA